MVVDYSQTINRYTQLDAYPLPCIDKMVSDIIKYRIFSTLDLRSAYHQIPIKPEEKPYMAFEACGRLYQFRRIPFGVTNGVANVQRVIDKIISNEKLKGTVAYIDNVTVCGYNEKDHNHNLQQFMAAINKYDLTLNEEKCSYNLKSIKLPGYIVRNGVMRPDPERFKPLMELPIPGNIAALRQALSMFAHYSQWVASFSEKIHLLTQVWTFPLSDSAIRAFQNLKRDIANSAIAAINPSAPLVVETDASDSAIAASLRQHGWPVAFFSRTLSKSERKHIAIEKEAYAIIEFYENGGIIWSIDISTLSPTKNRSHLCLTRKPQVK